MPFYNFKCRGCGVENEINCTIEQKESRAVRCPVCSSDELERVFKPFSVSVREKTAACPSQHDGCACCPRAVH